MNIDFLELTLCYSNKQFFCGSAELTICKKTAWRRRMLGGFLRGGAGRQRGAGEREETKAARQRMEAA